MSLLERLKAGTKNTKTIRFPGADEDVQLRVLSSAEIQEAHFDTERLFKRSEIEASMVTVDAYESEKTLQMLFRALRDPDDSAKPIAKTIDEFRKLISRDEKDFLVEEYTAFERECSPNPDAMSADEIETLIESLKKRPEETIGSVSSIVTARRLIISLVSRLPRSRKGSGFTSS